MNQVTGKYIIIIGALIIICGGLVYFFHDSFKWLGRLPGDIKVEKRNFKFYFPVVSMLVLSVLITIIVNIIRRFFNKCQTQHITGSGNRLV